MRLLRCTLVLALLAGCGQGPEAPPSASSGASVTAAASPQAPAPPATPREEYELFKRAARQVALDGQMPGPHPLFPDADSFDVYDCSFGSRAREAGAEAGGKPGLQEAALGFAEMESSLRKAGYSEAVTRDPLAAFEAELLAQAGSAPSSGGDSNGADAVSATFGVLAGRLEANRSRLQPEAPPIVSEGGCGAGEVATRFVASPPNGRIWLASKFSYNVCRVQGLDPWDRGRCQRWTEANQDQADFLSGRYVYQAEWPDGHVERGERTVAAASEDDEAQVITVRRR